MLYIIILVQKTAVHSTYYIIIYTLSIPIVHISCRLDNKYPVVPQLLACTQKFTMSSTIVRVISQFKTRTVGKEMGHGTGQHNFAAGVISLAGLVV